MVILCGPAVTKRDGCRSSLCDGLEVGVSGGLSILASGLIQVAKQSKSNLEYVIPIHKWVGVGAYFK